MATHGDIVQQAALNIGLKRSGQPLDGSNYSDLLKQLGQYLLAWDEDLCLDFDPLDASGVPSRRVPYLSNYFMYHPVFDRFDTKNTIQFRRVAQKAARLELAAAIEGETDYKSPEPENF